MVDEEKQDQPGASTTREIFDDLKEWSGKVFQKVKAEADTLSTKGRLKVDLTTLKSKRGSEFRKLGMKVFHLLEKDKYDIPEAASNLERINALTAQIREIERLYGEAGQKPPGEIAVPEGEPDREETGV